MNDDISITFDEQNKIRVLDADKFRETVLFNLYNRNNLK